MPRGHKQISKADLDTRIANAQKAVLIEAKKDSPHRHWAPRGPYLCTALVDGKPVPPSPESESPVWRGTVKEVIELIEKARNTFPVELIYLAGSFDGADSPRGYQNGEYEPGVANWKITVWTKEAGIIRDIS